MSTTLLISDLHLSEEEPHSFELFRHFLHTYAYSAHELYILGDLFEVWIGDDDLSPFHQTVITLLKTLTQKGIRIYLMHGNRDFLLGKRFAELTGCTLIPDPYLIHLFNQRILLTHGDSLCSNDKEYITYRKFVRTNNAQHLFLSIPLVVRRLIASLLRRYSQKRSRSKTTTALDVNPQEVELQLKKHQANLMIHGHTHLPGRHWHTLDRQPKERIVLGAWYKKGNVLIWGEQQNEWVEFDLETKK